MSIFNPRESAVLTTSIFNMPETKARDWIKKEHGYTLTSNQYRYTLGQIDANVEKRKKRFILEGVLKKQIEAIDRIDQLIGLSFKNAEACVAAEKFRDAQFVYNSMARLQEILTSYYDEVQGIIEYDSDQNKKMEDSREAQRIEDLNGFFESSKGSSSRHLTTN